MGLILPKYLLQQKRFKCDVCGFRFIKQTPSSVEKCPMCNDAAYEVGKDRNSLDPYSRHKERWYKNHSERHMDDIQHRKIIYKDGKQEVAFVDDKDQIIELAPDIPIPPGEKKVLQSKTVKTKTFIE